MTLSDANALAGVAALINSFIVVPSVVALRKIASRLVSAVDELDERVTHLETGKPKRKRRR